MKFKKILYVTIFMLLPLGEVGWGLTSCKSKKVALSVRTDSVVFHQQSISDSLFADTHFEFDKLDIWYMDSLPLDSVSPTRSHLLKHICISGGEINKTITKTNNKCVVDSTDLKSDKHATPVFTPPKPNRWLVIIILSALSLIIIASRTRK